MLNDNSVLARWYVAHCIIWPTKVRWRVVTLFPFEPSVALHFSPPQTFFSIYAVITAV